MTTYSQDTIDGYRAVTTASVCDALQSLGVQGFLSSQIRLRVGHKIVGPAVTVREEPTDQAEPPTLALDLIDAAVPGSVVVIDVDGASEVAVWGGLMTAGAVANKLAGAVLDAGVRDVEEIGRDFDFTVFARSTTPATTVGRFRTVESNVPVTCGGVRITPGDLIVGDSDGVVAVPAAHVDETLATAREIEEKERQQTKLILETGSLAEGMARYGRI
ncbi:regulator of RNase E activity RraA [Haloactinopolyspora alba]|uniref:Putative 4-hydroxy-4-methyl-2-oxoglutarate aldolase n=1 Tax=Haloactinopolyspora alba TaxID=648780 RepID=A0A2P8E2F6_9ACTN|nr:RraA family protein [Haloactinopolyspora alba]PSL03636.1 regulator of RNase E activity RraA [Haloactinopolyspora alba]